MTHKLCRRVTRICVGVIAAGLLAMGLCAPLAASGQERKAAEAKGKTIFFQEDFGSGKFDGYAWVGDPNDDSYSTGQFFADDKEFIDPPYSLRFDVKNAKDNQDRGSFIQAPLKTPIPEGATAYIAFYTKFAANQYWDDGDSNKHLEIRGDRADSHARIIFSVGKPEADQLRHLKLHTPDKHLGLPILFIPPAEDEGSGAWEFNDPSGSDFVQNLDVAHPAYMKTGRWHAIVIRADITSKRNGTLEMWLNGRKILKVENVRTQREGVPYTQTFFGGTHNQPTYQSGIDTHKWYDRCLITDSWDEVVQRGYLRDPSPPEPRTQNSSPENSTRSQPRPLHIEDAGSGIVRATLTGPEFHAPELFHGFEDYYHPRLKRLREEYELDKVVADETNEFGRILKLRHWVHGRWPIDNDQEFEGDAFAILEKAKTGCGFHCAHSMTVQQAVLSAMGYVARNVLVDRNHEDHGRSLHHGVNEVWSNDYAKWVLLDAKYDIHFERDGVPLSALELHEAVRADGGRGIVKVQGIERREVPDDGKQLHEGTKRSYWWVCYPQRQNPFTQPHFAARERLIIFDNEAFRRTTWHRDHSGGLAEHWAYAANAFIPTADRTQIEWTPGVVDLRVRRVAASELEVRIRSATPNFEAYVVRLNGGQPQTGRECRVPWKLQDGKNAIEVRSRNLFGVLGPSVGAAVSFNQ